ncbi:MAG: 16S rRNA (guanine(527)-N(7))-methyltransferase RsmG [Rhodobacteraceae bacterium]|nr:16S rRNA (guanine(527)-N(7))-methyltransferase RsmG [Paracoccaceae bacterium]
MLSLANPNGTGSSGNEEARTLLKDGVSRETFQRLEIFVDLLTDWNDHLNLISASTLCAVWQRHVIDSAQLIKIQPAQPGLWLDIGTGGGFPGLVVAILGEEFAPDTEYILLEATRRKAEFLRRVVTATGIRARVLPQRAETVAPIGAHCVSARAVAPLDLLLGLAAPHLNPDGVALLMKGRSADREIRQARESWQFLMQSHPSRTGSGVILALSEITGASHV